jgi:LPS-assembly lipoprotein
MSWSERARRSCIALLLAALALGPLAGCGFHLRGDVTYAFSTLYVNSPTATPLAGELRRTLEGGGTTLVDSAAAGEAILDISAVADDKQVLSLTGGGRVREYQLTKRVLFALHDANGRDWLPAAEVVVRRTYSFNESEVLAREAQETKYLREMQTDAVQQIVRRLHAAKKPA